jgi:hypothetical protein
VLKQNEMQEQKQKRKADSSAALRNDKQTTAKTNTEILAAPE